MPDYHVKAIEEAIKVLRFLAASKRLVSHQEIAEATRIPGANLVRVLGTLKTEGWAEEPATARWVCGSELAATAAAAFENRMVRAALEIDLVLAQLQKARKDGDYA